jgi:hypothetical protein
MITAKLGFTGRRARCAATKHSFQVLPRIAVCKITPIVGWGGGGGCNSGRPTLVGRPPCFDFRAFCVVGFALPDKTISTILMRGRLWEHLATVILDGARV